MLTRLYIRDFALIEEVEIEFGPGFNVLTGETGAGKSILMGALYCILGGQASADLVRSGAERCQVEGLFEFEEEDGTRARLAGIGVELEECQLTLRREIRANGRSRAFVDGMSVPLRRLREIGSTLVDLHGQHEHQTLLDPGLHGAFLDEFGGLTGAATRTRELFRTYQLRADELAALRRERETLRREEELRAYQLQEIRELAPQPEEEESLSRELELQENAEAVVQACAELFELLYQADGSVIDQLGRARRQLERLAGLDEALASQVAALEAARYGVEDLATTMRDYGERLEMQPGRAEELRQRLEALRRLRTKHGRSLAEVIELADELARQENRSAALTGEIADAETASARALDQLARACRELSAGRRSAAEGLCRAVEQGLNSLGMPHVRFVAELVPRLQADGLLEVDGQRYRADERGLEEIEFHIAPNAGEDPRPLARIASGGEISRIMLALKEVIAERDTVSTLVFDEIDVGISGRIAAAVARKLQALSESHQLVVITHLPQIASAAQQHYAVRKRGSGGRSVTEVQPLSPEERAEEIAYLLAGDTVSDTARQHAKEMLQ